MLNKSDVQSVMMFTYTADMYSETESSVLNIYSIYSVSYISQLPLSTLAEESWITIFVAKAGIGASVFSLWNGNTFTGSDVKYADTCKCHYKSELVENWAETGIRKVSWEPRSIGTRLRG
jgi:hypothetical protein